MGGGPGEKAREIRGHELKDQKRDKLKKLIGGQETQKGSKEKRLGRFVEGNRKSHLAQWQTGCAARDPTEKLYQEGPRQGVKDLAQWVGGGQHGE